MTGLGFTKKFLKLLLTTKVRTKINCCPPSSSTLFHGLDPSSPQFHEQLIQRLERPILDSFQKTKKYSDSVKQQIPALEKPQKQT